MVRVENGHIVDRKSLLIRQARFDAFNVQIHGITKEMVKNAPKWDKAWPVIREYLGDLPLVAHNAAFDTGVIRDALNDAAMPWPNISYACTLVLSRRTYDLLSYRLPYTAAAAGIDFDENAHHDATYDASIAALIMLDIASQHAAESFDDLFAKTRVRMGVITGDSWNGCNSKSLSNGSSHYSGPSPTASQVEVNTNADPDGILYGQGVTFTGALSSMTRQVAWEAVAGVGGIPLDSVTKHTNLLVFGYQDSRFLKPGAAVSAKFDKALKLKEKGAAIEVVGEDEFLKMLDETTCSGSRIESQ